MKVAPVNPSELDFIWEEVKTHLGKIEDDRISLDDVKWFIENGSYILVTAEENDEILGALLMHFRQYPNEWTAVVSHLAGVDMVKWFSYLPYIESLARDYGCNSIEAMGRKGWERYLKNEDYEFEAITLRKKL